MRDSGIGDQSVRADGGASAAGTSGGELIILADLTARGFAELAHRIAKAGGVPILELLGRRRAASVARARNALYAALRAEGLSYPEIGALLRRDHCTVMSGVKRAAMAPLRVRVVA